MLEPRYTMQPTGPAHGGFKDRRQLILHGDPIAKADQLAFMAEVDRFGFYATEFSLDVVRFPGKRSGHAVAATFAVTVENIQSGRCATYVGGPGRAWMTEFVLDLVAGTLGRP